MLKTISSLILIILISSHCSAQNKSLSTQFGSFKNDPCLKHANWSVKAVKVYNNTTVISYNSEASLPPASLMKLITTSAGFYLLGDDFRFKTLLMHDGNISQDSVLNGNLYIVGGGDPLLGSYRYKQTTPNTVFSNWETALQKVGIKTINGNLYYDASIFDAGLIPDSWIWEDIGNYYGCGASGLSFHENMYHIYFSTDTISKFTKILRIEPNLKSLILKNEVTTAGKNTGDNVTIYGAPYDNSRYLTGTIPSGQKEFPVRGSLPNPPMACMTLFYDYLLEKGYLTEKAKILDASNQAKSVKNARKSIIEYNSHSYPEIVILTNSQSNNMYAECIFKYLGYLDSQKGTYPNGKKAITTFLKNKNFNLDGIDIVDGSGLSRQNLVTSDFICDLLRFMSLSPSAKNFSLSLLGSSRSILLNRILDNKKKESLSFKTGSMDKVRSYAGYINNSQGEQVCFSIIVNNFTCSQNEIRAKIERLIYQISESS